MKEQSSQEVLSLESNMFYKCCRRTHTYKKKLNNGVSRDTPFHAVHPPLVGGAHAAYPLVHAEIAPGLMEAIVNHANMEHLQGKAEDACSLYEQAIAIEKGKKKHSQTLP